MKIVAWDDAYSVKNEEIDCEHMVFVKIIQKIQKSIAHKEHDRTVRLLDELAKYAAFHFVSEENIMHDIEYADIAAHQSEHKKLLATLQYKLGAIRSGEESEEDIIPFLLDWFVTHTTTSDLKLSKSILHRQGG